MRSRIESFNKCSALRLLILFCLFYFLEFSVYSQSPANSSNGLDSLILATEKYVASKNYEMSHATIRQIFNNYLSFPNVVVFLYGKTMLGKKQYVLSRDAFKKYLSSEEAQKLYSNEAVLLLDSAIKFICPLCDNTGYRDVEAACAKCNGDGRIESDKQCSLCNGVGTTVCQTCLGRGVIYQKKGISDVYQHCVSCDGKGYSFCRKCKGSKVESHFCDLCAGTGKVKSRETCVHH